MTRPPLDFADYSLEEIITAFHQDIPFRVHKAIEERDAKTLETLSSFTDQMVVVVFANASGGDKLWFDAVINQHLENVQDIANTLFAAIAAADKDPH